MGLRLLNWLVANVALYDWGLISELAKYWEIKSGVPLVMLMGIRLQDAASSKTTPLFQHGQVSVPNDTFLEKRVRAINLASKLEFSMDIAIKIMQKSVYNTRVSSNLPEAASLFFKKAQEMKRPLRFTDMKYYDFSMAGKTGELADDIKVEFFEMIGDKKKAQEMRQYCDFNRKFDYVYPYGNGIVSIRYSDHYASGRRDTALHGSIVHIILFVDSVLKYDESLEKDFFIDFPEARFKLLCFGDDGGHNFGRTDEEADKFLDFYIKNASDTFQLRMKIEDPPKYLGVIYDVNSKFYGKTDPYAIVRKMFSPERMKSDPLVNVSHVSRWLALRSIFGPKEGDAIIKMMLKTIESEGFLRLSKKGYLQRDTFISPLSADIAANIDPMDALVKYSRLLTNVSSNELGDIGYGLMNIGIDSSEFFEDITENKLTREETLELIKDSVDLCLLELRASLINGDFVRNIRDIAMKIKLIISTSKRLSPESLALQCFDILKDLTPNYK